MSKTISIILVSIIALCCPISVNADTVTSVSLTTDNVTENRLFEIDVMINSVDIISAAQMTISYDSGIVDFRDVKSDYFEVEASKKDNQVAIAFVDDTGVKASDLKAVSFQFKCINTGTFDIDIKNCVCLDNECENISVSTTGIEISVDEKGITSKSKSSKKSTVSGEKSKLSASDEISDETGEVIKVDSREKSGVRAILLGVSIAVVFVSLFLLGTIYAKKKDENLELDDEEDED